VGGVTAGLAVGGSAPAGPAGPSGHMAAGARRTWRSPAGR